MARGRERQDQKERSSFALGAPPLLSAKEENFLSQNWQRCLVREVVTPVSRGYKKAPHKECFFIAAAAVIC